MDLKREVKNAESRRRLQRARLLFANGRRVNCGELTRECDTTTVDQTLVEAGMAVAELVGREAEARPGDEPKVNANGIEELVADKGYHSGAVVLRVQECEVHT